MNSGGGPRRFSEFKTLGSAVPNTGPGVYTI